MPVNEIYCSLFCDQFVPLSLFIVAYLDMKIIAICYENCQVVHQDKGAIVNSKKMLIVAVVVFTL